MTVSIVNDYIEIEVQEKDRNAYLSNVISSAYKLPQAAETDICTDVKKILNLTAISMKSLANSHFKVSTCLEVNEIEKIKESLDNYSNKNEKVTEFKNALIEDLTAFQKQINANYFERLAELEKAKQFCEKQIRVLDFDKHKLIMERLAKVEWPYDEKTKEFDSKISALELKLQKMKQKIEQFKKGRPSANEKDMLIYQMQLKEKFVK